jgi:4-hydroxy-tetrahydrodipicolinate reductase
MMKSAAEVAPYFSAVEIIEMHHPGKLDSPSGTALRTAEMIAAERKEVATLLNSRETVKGARGASYQDIPIHSVRLPGLLAHQEVLFGGTGETLTIRHDTMDRECFMPGVVLACRKVKELDSLVVGLEKIL